MTNYLRLLFLQLSLLPIIAFSQTNIPPTRYNWTTIANNITKNCYTDYERVEAIYKWICKNISYDTSYSIYHADECWNNKRGVCQAYSELFYHIAKALDIRVDIISGRSKDITGDLGNHSWIYAETNKQHHTGILIDPTWGAGSVNNGVFTRNDNDMTWFHIDPRILIFTHFPEDQSYQLLNNPISYDKFLTLPAIYPEVLKLGFTAEELFEHCKKNPNDIPNFYNFNNSDLPFYINNIPLSSTLRPGETYHFSIRKNRENFALICNDEFVKNEDWQYNNGVYTLNYTVPCGNKVKLSWYNEKENSYYRIIDYKIATPTATDLRKLELKRPFATPEIMSLKGVNKEYMEEMGFNGSKLLEAVRNGYVTCLPKLYNKEYIRVVDIPYNGILHSGQSYYFKIKPKCNGNWVVINNGEWHYNWASTPNGNELEIFVIPKSGTLKICIQYEQGGSYHTCIEYDVK